MAKYPYQNPSLPVEDRVKDLLKRMTLNQKVRQLTCLQFMGVCKPELLADGVGEVVFAALNPDLADGAKKIREIQDAAIKSNEWGIPAIIHSEALTGALIVGCAIFPSSISIGASYEPELLNQMADYIRQQMVDLGVREALAPVLDLARDFRWGRTNEDYSSDPTLVSAMCVSYIKGLQGKDIKHGVACTTKHLLGYSLTENGINTARVQTDWRDLRENYAKPFEAAIRLADLKCVMNCYSEIDGDLVCNSKKILTDLLRDDMGFKGVVVSDYGSVERLVDSSKTAENYTEAAIKCLEAGLDVELPNQHCYGPELREAVKAGKIDEKYIDLSCSRILKLKFELGLFDHPYDAYTPIDNTEPHKLSKLMSEKAITLVQNNGILPLTDKNLKVAVIGPTGNSIRILHGSYSVPANIEMMMYIQNRISAIMPGIDLSKAADMPKDDGTEGKEKLKEMNMDLGKLVAPISQPNPADLQDKIENTIRSLVPGAKTIYEAVKDIFPKATYTLGCYLADNEKDDIAGAVKAAKDADVVILTIGGKNGWGADCTSGEGIDNVAVELSGKQEELALKVMAANKKTIVVHLNNRPLVAPAIYEKAPAILECFFPGPFGGVAIAKAISGAINPGGRLPVDTPRATGQTPLYYYQHNGSRSDNKVTNSTLKGYVFESDKAQYAFGHGLSYTTFEYSEGKLDSSLDKAGVPVLKASVKVTNTGKVLGDEVVMLFGKDEFASIVRPQQELIGFKRISLKPGETKKVTLTFRLDQLAFQNANKDWVIEKGKFTFDFAKDADTPLIPFTYELNETKVIDHTLRGFFATAEVE